MRRVTLAPLWLTALTALVLALAASAPRLATPQVASAAACSPLPHAPGNVTRTITSGGVSRTYELHVPSSYDGVTPIPLVLNFHGRGSNIWEQTFVSGLNARADTQGFFVATPLGRSTSLIAQTHWNNPQLPPSTGESDDVLFSSKVIDDVAAQVCIDVARVYATGYSNGGLMSARLACSLSSRIAAIAPVAGVYYPPMAEEIPGEVCQDTRPVPLVAFHGTADQSIPYDGGVSPGLGVTFRDIDDVVMPAWAAHNGCGATPTTTLAAPGINLIEYTGCADAAAVQLYSVFDYDGDGPLTEGGAHNWPGSPYAPPGHTNAIDATDVMLAFFAQHTLPCAAGDADCDTFADAVDVCPAVYDPGQLNNDANFIDLSPPKAFDDVTLANSDGTGNDCDPDDDNDGLSDAQEAAGSACGGALTSPLASDSDGDLFIDGAECASGSNPLSDASIPNVTAEENNPCLATTDADGDGVIARFEVCFYGTDPNSADTDGDGCADGREAASVNADLAVNSLDLSQVAQTFTAGPYPLPASAVHRNYDQNKDGKIDAIDLSRVAQRYGAC